VFIIQNIIKKNKVIKSSEINHPDNKFCGVGKLSREASLNLICYNFNIFFKKNIILIFLS